MVMFTTAAPDYDNTNFGNDDSNHRNGRNQAHIVLFDLSLYPALGVWLKLIYKSAYLHKLTFAVVIS